MGEGDSHRVLDMLRRDFAGSALSACRAPTTISRDMELQKALKILDEKSLVSAPVHDESTGKFWGFISVHDILLYCLGDGSESHDAASMVQKSVADCCVAQAKDWGPQATVDVCTNLGDCWAVMQSSRSDKVMVVQSAEANGNMLLGIIDIMHIFHKIIALIPMIGLNRHLNVMKMKNLSAPMHELDSNVSARRVIVAIGLEKAKIVGIKHCGVLTYSLDGERLRGFRGAHIDLIDQPIRSVLRRIEGGLRIKAPQPLLTARVLTCTGETTLEEVINLIKTHEQRVVHVVNANQLAVASLTIENVINEILRF